VTSSQIHRPRRRRRTDALRRLVREHELSAADFIAPLFVVHGRGIAREIGSMPGVFHLCAVVNWSAILVCIESSRPFLCGHGRW
jgi:porphobilinogen synthase